MMIWLTDPRPAADQPSVLLALIQCTSIPDINRLPLEPLSVLLIAQGAKTDAACRIKGKLILLETSSTPPIAQYTEPDAAW